MDSVESVLDDKCVIEILTGKYTMPTFSEGEQQHRLIARCFADAVNPAAAVPADKA